MDEQISVKGVVLTVGETSDNKNYTVEELPATFTVDSTEDGVQPIVTILGKSIPMSEIQEVLDIMQGVKSLAKKMRIIE